MHSAGLAMVIGRNRGQLLCKAYLDIRWCLLQRQVLFGKLACVHASYFEFVTMEKPRYLASLVRLR